MPSFGEYTPSRPSPAARAERIRELRKILQDAKAELDELMRQEPGR